MDGMQFDAAFVRSVGEDLGALEQYVHAPEKLNYVRSASLLLKRLLVGSSASLPKAQEILGLKGHHRIVAPDIEPFIQQASKELALITAGGGTFGGATHAANRYYRHDPPREARDAAPELEHTYTLSAFLASPSLYLQGLRITRGEVVTFVAKRLGGVDYDLGPTAAEERTYELLEFAYDFYSNVGGYNALHLEVHSIGQLLLGSEDTRALRSLLEAYLRAKGQSPTEDTAQAPPAESHDHVDKS